MDFQQIILYVFIWMLFNALPVWFVIYTEKRLMPDAERDKNFQPFLRKDRPRWSYMYSFITCWAAILRPLIGWVAVLSCVITTQMVDCRSSDSKKPLSKTRKNIINFMFAICSRMHDFCMGCLWSQRVRVEVDYSYWLGPDYVYRYDKVGIHVLNHLGMQDIIHSLYLKHYGGYSSSFIGKKELTDQPLLGKLVEPLDSLLVGRDTKDTKEQRNAIVDQIKERQISAERGDREPLTIFPEGCSTSGEYVINFKRGAFASLRAVKPFSAKTWAPDGFSVNSGGCMPFMKQCMAACIALFWTYTLKEMPVFEPNEYFWKNHWDGKEEKWIPFSKAVRQLIAEQNNLKLSDNWAEDKLKYKIILRESKKKTK